MKKSDAVKKLVDFMDTTPCPSSNVEMAIVLLNFFEHNLGMFPPLEPDRRITDLDLGPPEWEPEDAN